MSGTGDQGPERDVRGVLSDAAGVETRLLCWAGLGGAVRVRFLRQHPKLCYYRMSRRGGLERRLGGRIRLGCCFKLGCRTLGHGPACIHSE